VAQIDHIDMTDPDNILYFEGGSSAINFLAGVFTRAARSSDPVRVTIDGGSLKVKVSDESWSHPMPTQRPHGGYHKNGEQS